MSLTDQQVFAAVKKHGSERAAARALGLPRTTFQDAHYRAKRNQFASRKTVVKRTITAPKRAPKRFILTSAQDSTDVHQPFLRNLRAYADHLGAELRIGGFTYNKSLFENHSNKKAAFHSSIEPFMCNEQLDIGGKVLFCGEINTSPTATTPLSGFETYTRDKWGVFPHPRIALQSIATMFNSPPKLIMTTGAVTYPNYVPKKAGIKAEFHHVIGAVIVELDTDGDVFCRHLIADKDGDFYDLTTFVCDGDVLEEIACAVEAITWGDIHLEQLDPVVKDACWGANGMLDALWPNYQFFHDTLDFQARNHHNSADPHHAFEMWLTNKGSVEGAIQNVAEFLRATMRNGTRSIVVESNHDLMFKRWLKETDYRTDPENALFFLKSQTAVYNAIAQCTPNYSPLYNTLFDFLPIGTLDQITFLAETDTFRICQDANGHGGIECAIHGHRGANGAKGHFQSFARMGPKANVGHTHSAAIHEGIYCAGTSSKMDMGYNRGGLSSWSHSHIVTYVNGKRTIVTMQGPKWHAAGGHSK